jgi:hypothetical protein
LEKNRQRAKGVTPGIAQAVRKEMPRGVLPDSLGGLEEASSSWEHIHRMRTFVFERGVEELHQQNQNAGGNRMLGGSDAYL